MVRRAKKVDPEEQVTMVKKTTRPTFEPEGDGRDGDPCPRCGGPMYVAIMSGARYLLCSDPSACITGGKV